MLTPYKQTLTHSCLVACLLMIIKSKYQIKFNKKDEHQLTLKGSSRSYPYYVVGIPYKISNFYNIKIQIITDNKYFTEILKKCFLKNKKVEVVHKKINLQIINILLKDKPIICHIDDNLLGDYSHASHFIVLEKVINKKFQIIDPWDGRRKLINQDTLLESINSLKNHIKMCPLLYYIK